MNAAGAVMGAARATGAAAEAEDSLGMVKSRGMGEVEKIEGRIIEGDRVAYSGTRAHSLMFYRS